MSDWEVNVRRVEPYTPGEQPKEAGIVKLNTNESPFPPSPMVAEVLRGFDADSLRLYPDPAVTDLNTAIAARYGLRPSQVFTGVGSDDVLAQAFLTFFNSGKPVLFPDISYSFYDVWTELYRIPYRMVPVDENFCIHAEDYLTDNGGIVIANPNAPTGLEMDPDQLERIISGNPGSVVIVDEAYVDFGARSVIPLIDRYDNLLVVQTFSKSRSMAGMRIGFAAGSEKLIRYLNDVKYSTNSYTLSRIAIAAGCAAVADDEWFRGCCAEIIRIREWAKDELRKRGFVFGDSKSNFIFAAHKSVPGEKIFRELKARHIYVRWFSKPRISNCLRITVGSEESMQKLFDALDEIV